MPRGSESKGLPWGAEWKWNSLQAPAWAPEDSLHARDPPQHPGLGASTLRSPAAPRG